MQLLGWKRGVHVHPPAYGPVRVSNHEIWYNTEIGEYRKWFCKYFKACDLFFSFKLCHFKAFDDYITLHNLSMPLTYIVTLYHNTVTLYTRDVVIVSLTVLINATIDHFSALPPFKFFVQFWFKNFNNKSIIVIQLHIVWSIPKSCLCELWPTMVSGGGVGRSEYVPGDYDS